MNLKITKHSKRRYLRGIYLVLFILLIPKLMLAQTFVHPGILHKESDFDRMRQKVQAGLQPWQSGWAKLIANSHAQLNYTPNPVTTLIRGTGYPENYSTLMNDAAAAYQCGLRWKISGDNAYADKAVQILNIWASTCTGVDGSPDIALAVGLQGFQLANAAEIMRSYSGWSASDFAKFKNFMIKVFYANASRFLYGRNGTCPSTYFANWGLCNASAVVAIGILCDDMQIYNEGMYYFKSGPYTEAINNVVYYLHTPILGQWQESNRDQSHSMMGVGLASDLCEMAWNQGENLYSFANSRLLAGFEYVAKYNLWNDVPDIPYNNCTNANLTSLGTLGRGGMRPIWERIYNHFVNRVGVQVPYSQQFASLSRPEGGGGDYGTTSGGFDNIGFGTLTNSLDPLPAGCVPSGLTPFVQINGGAQTQTSNLTVQPGSTVKLSPQTSDGGTWSWSNGQNTREIVLTNLQKSGIYRATFTNGCGMQSMQSFCIGVYGDCLPTPIIPYTRVNTNAWQQADRLVVDSGASIIFGPQPVNQGHWRWSTGDTVRQITINNWKVSANIVAYYTSPCGVSVVDTFRITVRNPKLDLMTVLNAAIKLRDTTKTSATVITGMYPVAAKALLNDSIVYVQSHYDSLKSTKTDINSYIGVLNRSIVRYKQSVYYDTNKLQDGTYYMMNVSRDSLLTVSTNNATQFTTKADDKKSQLFSITKQSNGRYKITILASPPSGYQNYINETGQIGKNNFDPTWNTYNVFFDGQHYAIERAQNAGNGFWSINGNFIGYQTGTTNSPLPAAFPFTLQPDIYFALDQALAQASKLRDTTQTTTGTELGKFPQSANKQLSDSIAYVQGQYNTISTVSQSTALVNKLNNAMSIYRKSMFYGTNQLADGIYFIKNGDQESYWTMTSGNTPDFEQRNNNINLQRWKITKQPNGRYAINSINTPPTGYQNYINENAQFGKNVYDATWNTMMFYFDGAHYAIERAQQAGNGYWNISNNGISTTGNLSDAFPYNYPFKVVLAPDTQRINFAPIGNLHVNDQPVTLNAQATSGLPVTFASSDTTIARVVSNSLRILKAGTCTIVATQPGNGFFAAASVSQSVTVNKLVQSITFNTLPARQIGDADFDAGATTNSGLAINYTSADTTIVTILNGKIHIAGLGSTTITAAQAGNDVWLPAASVSQTLSVIDQIPPIVKTKDVILSLDASGNATLTVSQVDNGSSDNVGIATLTVDKTSFSCANVGPNTVTLTATDASGNTSSGIATVTVKDVTAPLVPVLADVTGECSATASVPTATDNCAGTVMGTTGDPLTYSTQGTHVIHWSFDDGNGNVSTATQNVVIKDVTAPIVPVLADVTGECSATATVPTTTDNCAGTVTGTTTDALTYSSQGTHVIHWSFDDGNGNVSTATQNVVIKDVTAPVVPVLADVNGECSATASVPTTTDNCAGTVTGTTTDALTYSAQGTHVIHWSFDDGNGNVSTATQNVVIKDDIAPIVPVLADVTGECSATATVPTTTDNCAGTVTGTTTDPLTYVTQGTHVIHWSFSDGNGNVSTVTQNVVIKDDIAPTAIAQNLTVQLDATGKATITPAQINNGSSDNCAIATYSLDKTTFDCSNVGQNNVTLTVTDASGNSSNATAVVTVQDNTAPVVLTRNITVYLSGGMATISAAQVDNGSNDACGIKTMSLNRTSFDCSSQGDNTVTLTVTDNHNNSATGTAVVTVIGKTPNPAITVSRADNTYTGLDTHTIALGYGAQSLTLTASDANSATGDSFSWSPAAGLSGTTTANPVFTPTQAGSYTFTVTATSQYGCQAGTSVTINVIDARCGTNKVSVCHATGSSTNPYTQLCISANAVPAQLANGGTLGSCSAPVKSTASLASTIPSVPIDMVKISTGPQVALKAYPNPFGKRTTIAYSVPAFEQNVTLEVFNITGHKVATLYAGSAQANVTNEYPFDGSRLAQGVYFVRLTTSKGVQTFRLVMTE